MMTGEEYKASLNDGRKVYSEGKLVDNVVTHPLFKRTVEEVAKGYDHFYDPSPSAISSYLRTPATIEELREHEASEPDLLTSSTYASIMTLLTAADRIQDIRPEGSDAIRRYVREVQERDVRLAESITDAKGDRSKKPGQQEDPDAYLRVVERRPDGVVIRGAKLHISNGPVGHELMTIPTKAMRPGEEAYAIACAVPVNAPGVKIVSVTSQPKDEISEDAPISANLHIPTGFVIYDDVFVPHERIFLDGETKAAAIFAHSLGLWIRVSGLKRMADEADMMVGFAQLITEANGLEKVDQIKDKIADMVIHATLVRASLEAAIAHSEITASGAVVPNELYSNAGKFHGAAYRSLMIRNLHDIAGGSLATAPSTRDLDNPDIGPLVRKYMGTKQSVDGIYRTKLFLALRDLTSSSYAGYEAVATIQGGGGLYAQKVVTRGRYDMQRAKNLALDAAGLVDPHATA